MWFEEYDLFLKFEFIIIQINFLSLLVMFVKDHLKSLSYEIKTKDWFYPSNMPPHARSFWQ